MTYGLYKILKYSRTLPTFFAAYCVQNIKCVQFVYLRKLRSKQPLVIL
jgi:hypothetical protein